VLLRLSVDLITESLDIIMNPYAGVRFVEALIFIEFDVDSD
jgi:hypothetical protein